MSSTGQSPTNDPDPLAQEWVARLKPGPDGLIAAIAQDVATGAVLMLAHMDREALRRTLETGQVVYWSRSRQTYWRKGETSGHTQQLVSAALDCDGDAVLLKVIQTGPACHTGTATCFTSREIPLPDRRASVTPAGGDDDA